MSKKEIKESNETAKQKPVSDNFTKAIKKYLDELAETDEHFKNCYCNPKKSIVECCAYIVGQVKKLGVMGLSDDEVYQMARHYFLEEINPDDLKMTYQPNQVITNSKIELTDVEREELRKKAIEEYKSKCVMEEKERLEKIEAAKRKKELEAIEKKQLEEAKRKEKEEDPNYFGGLFDMIEG